MYCLSIIVCFSGVERGISGGFMGAEWGGGTLEFLFCKEFE